jgi:hypothetical protein
VEAFAFILFWGLATYAFFTKKKHALLYILFGVMPFGSFAVIPTALTGVTLTATPIIMLMIIFRTFFVKGGLDTFTTYALKRNHLLLLFAFWTIAIFVTIFMPRFFKGDVMVIPMNLSASYAIPLEPTTQNFTQMIYITISTLAVFAFGMLLQNIKMRQHALNAICLASGVAVLTGVLDYLNQYVSLDFLLNAFRNANYGLAVDQQLFDAKRIVGLMPEPSSFGTLCIGFLTTLYFFRRTIDNEVLRERVVPLLIILLLTMVWLSTSSAGLVGLGIFGLLAIVEWVWRAQTNTKNKIAKRGLIIELWLFNILVITTLTILLLKPSLFNPITELIDTMVFKKTESSSYEERSMWTSVSWQALIDSYGIGVGLGGTRASNGVVVLMSSVGFLGAFLYYSFLLQTFFRRASKEDEYGTVMISAFRWSFLPPFLMDFLIGTTPDFGVFNAFRFGLVFAISYPTLLISKY